MPALIPAESRKTYAAQRGVSQGAHITLTSVSGGYRAMFECADRAAGILGSRNYSPDFHTLLIPTEELHRGITKLAEQYSVALVDTVTDDQGTRFVLVWKIGATTKAVGGSPIAQTVLVAAGDDLDSY